MKLLSPDASIVAVGSTVSVPNIFLLYNPQVFIASFVIFSICALVRPKLFVGFIKSHPFLLIST